MFLLGGFFFKRGVFFHKENFFMECFFHKVNSPSKREFLFHKLSFFSQTARCLLAISFSCSSFPIFSNNLPLITISSPK